MLEEQILQLYMVNGIFRESNNRVSTKVLYVRIIMEGTEDEIRTFINNNIIVNNGAEFRFGIRYKRIDKSANDEEYDPHTPHYA
jgi:hypothetical protein